MQPWLDERHMPTHLLRGARTFYPMVPLTSLPFIPIGCIGTTPCLSFYEEETRGTNQQDIDLCEYIGSWLDDSVMENDPTVWQVPPQVMGDVEFSPLTFALVDPLFKVEHKASNGSKETTEER